MSVFYHIAKGVFQMVRFFKDVKIIGTILALFVRPKQ